MFNVNVPIVSYHDTTYIHRCKNDITLVITYEICQSGRSFQSQSNHDLKIKKIQIFEKCSKRVTKEAF